MRKAAPLLIAASILILVSLFAPVSDFVKGIASGIGTGLGILALTSTRFKFFKKSNKVSNKSSKRKKR